MGPLLTKTHPMNGAQGGRNSSAAGAADSAFSAIPPQTKANRRFVDIKTKEVNQVAVGSGRMQRMERLSLASYRNNRERQLSSGGGLEELPR